MPATIPRASAPTAPAGADPTRATTEALWRDLSDPLRRFLRARSASDAEAEDLLQDVFVRVQRNLPGLRDLSKLEGWVYRIARHAVVDHYRTRRRHQPLAFDPADDGPAGEMAVDLRPSLRRFIAELPAAYREPLVRHEFQGEPIATVAAAMGLTPSAAKSRVRRARLQLRAMLDRCCRFEFDRRGRVIAATPRSVCDCRG